MQQPKGSASDKETSKKTSTSNQQRIVDWKNFEAFDRSFACMVPNNLKLIERKLKRKYEVFIGKSENSPEYYFGFQAFDEALGEGNAGKQEARLLLPGPWDQHPERVPCGTEEIISRDECEGLERVFEYGSGRERKVRLLSNQKGTRTYFFYADNAPFQAKFWNSISIRKVK